MFCLRVVVFDTVDVVLYIHSERHSIQTLLTDYTAETARMIGLAECLEDLYAPTHTQRQKQKTTVKT